VIAAFLANSGEMVECTLLPGSVKWDAGQASGLHDVHRHSIIYRVIPLEVARM
jgi:hypothetical protein